MNFLESLGLIFLLIISIFVLIELSYLFAVIIEKFTKHSNTNIIKKDTIFYNYKDHLQIVTGKDIKIRFKKKLVTYAYVENTGIYLYTYSKNKELAQSEIEDKLIKVITDEYNGTHSNTYITDNYVDDIVKF